MRLGILIAVAAGAMTLATDHCQAQMLGGFGGSFLYGAGYGLYVYERIPQYSLFPPVYYKHPVPRAYGYSPYAYPPGYVTPPASATSRVVVVNQYVPQASSSKDAPAGGSQPLVIHNPYVTARNQAGGPAPAPADTATAGG